MSDEDPTRNVVRYTRIETTADGGSCFTEGSFPLDSRTVATGVPPMSVGALPSETGMAYVRSEAFDSAAHPAPAHQWVIMLRGTIEVTTSDGESRRFTPGDLLLAADTAGSGHRTAAFGAPPFEALFVPVDPDRQPAGR